MYPAPQDLEIEAPRLESAGLRKPFWIYLVAAALVGAGYADFLLIAFHFGQRAVVPAATIPVLYAIAMAVDALAALVSGRLFDRWGLLAMTVAVALSALFAPLVFFGGFVAAVAGMALWGVGLGAQESIMRAAVAAMVPADRRGSAYGIFNTGYGLSWFAGSVAMGVLYSRSLALLVGFSVVAQVGAIPLLLWARRAGGTR